LSIDELNSGGGLAGDQSQFLERKRFRESRAIDVISELIPVLGGSNTAQCVVGEVLLPNPANDVMSPPLVQGSSTLFTIECLARIGLHRLPILNSDRFVLGMVTEVSDRFNDNCQHHTMELTKLCH
jgi:hypothetical protein